VVVSLDPYSVVHCLLFREQVLANFGILLALLCGHVFQRIFFGALRPIEVEVCP